jgi:hypothetical protein
MLRLMRLRFQDTSKNEKAIEDEKGAEQVKPLGKFQDEVLFFRFLKLIRCPITRSIAPVIVSKPPAS